VRALDLPDAVELAGTQNRPLQGALDPQATAVALALSDDRGYWIALAGVPATDVPDLPTFDVRLGFAHDLPSQMRTLTAQAVDGHGNFGPPATVPVTLLSAAIPVAPLVISLEWQGTADLDLHVIDPDGVEIWSGHLSGYQAPPPPALPDPTAAAMAPQLDFDSNAGCHFDGRDREDVVYKNAPAAGTYVVRVDATSLCGESFVDWKVSALAEGESLATAGGEALDGDTRGDHGRGAGRTAFALDLP
jgi:hypothetical protein